MVTSYTHMSHHTHTFNIIHTHVTSYTHMQHHTHTNM